ncbi:hypothetical protein ACIQPQ_31305 [Streptomyces sp. NPDC091281]|uniref:hypothetical protein n=1 Tax=Streptomyces sp. NPDC091281 TaxID=3365985 RepID=UPI00380D060C
MPTYTITRPVRPSGVITAKVRAASPAEATRKADAGTYSIDPDFAAKGYTVDLNAEPEVWELHGLTGSRSRHISGPRYSD